MTQLGNPSVTTPRMGDRSRASRVSPRNITGRLYATQHAEKAAREAAAGLDVNEVRRTEYLRGHADGYGRGLEAGWDACVRALVAEGVLDPDEPGDDDEAAG
ncbi:MAG TPA: hypothetical protein VFO01_11505 [Trebonia sp.]|nr:hypothetical protein [Trebonia sp.]